MQKAGFFRDESNPSSSVRAAKGEQTDRSQVVGYLSRGALLVGSPGLEPCLLGDDELVEVHMLTDGEWVWPAELVHYVESHGVVVPDALLRRMRNLDYEVPAVDEAQFEEIERELFDG